MKAFKHNRLALVVAILSIRRPISTGWGKEGHGHVARGGAPKIFLSLHRAFTLSTAEFGGDRVMLSLFVPLIAFEQSLKQLL